MGLNNGVCDVCSKVLTSYLQDENGNCYCSEKCFEQTFPKCNTCGKPMKQWTESETGKKYCSEQCYEKELPKCNTCGRPMKQWTESETGKKYCSEQCYEKELPKCDTCGRPMKQWSETEDGKKFCSDNCFLESCPICDMCGKHTDHWHTNDQGEVICSEACWNLSLPKCEVCEKTMDEWLVSQDGHKYCSDECYSTILPKCMHCGRPMKEWLVTQDGRIYCSQHCNNESDKLMTKVHTFTEMTGLSVQEVETLMISNSWTFDETVDRVDEYMSLLNENVVDAIAIADATKNAEIFGKLANNLSEYNTMRGGANGFKGFVFEELHAAEATLNNIATEVIANNSIADFQIIKPDGSIALGQAKAGYNTSKVDWSLYKGQDIIIDKGNSKLINDARKAGMNVIESDISNMDASNLAKKMQLESKVFKRPNAPITSHLHSYHKAGVNTAKKGAAFGAGLSLGSNIVDLATGDKSVGEAAVGIAVDTTVATASSYVIGAGTTALANTALGGTVISGVTAAGGAFATTSVGASVVAASSAVAGVAGAAGAAISGSAAVGAVGAAATVIGGTAAGAAVVAAAPLVVAGATIGAVFSIGRKLFGK